MKIVLLLVTACLLVGAFVIPIQSHENDTAVPKNEINNKRNDVHSLLSVRAINRVQFDGWALLIGMNDEGERNTHGYEDVSALRDYLISIGYREENILLLGNATLSEAREGLRWLINNAGKNSVAIFYYSGHGTRNAFESGLCLWDDVLWERELKKILDELLSENIFVGIDACVSGNFADYMPCNSLGGPGRVVTTSSGDWTASYATEEGGIFSHYFIKEGLKEGKGDMRPFGNGDGRVSVEEAFKYAFMMIGTTHLPQLPRMNDQYQGELVL